MDIGEIKNWDDMNNALDKLTALGGALSRPEQLEAMKGIRQRACDLAPNAENDEDAKRITIETMTWAIDTVSAEVQQAAIELKTNRTMDLQEKIVDLIFAIRELRADLAQTLMTVADMAVTADREESKHAFIAESRAYLAQIDAMLVTVPA